MPSISDILNDYSCLVSIPCESGRSCFEAIQNGTRRTVILEVLEQKNASVEKAAFFLEEAKIKASVDCPHVCSVLEAGERDGILFLSREKPSGSSLCELKNEGKPFSTGDILHILSIISDIFTYFEHRGINTSRADISNIYMGDTGFSFINTAIPGKRNEKATQEDMQILGTQLALLIPCGSPGATRLTTICKIMAEGHMGNMVDWSQIQEMTQTVLEQLGHSKGSSTKMVIPRATKKTLQFSRFIGWITLIIILSAASFFILFNKGEKTPPLPTKHKTPSFLNRDHTLIPIASTSSQEKNYCDAHEVTIGAYSKFLESLENMPDSGKNQFDSPNQPSSKKNHIPADWDNMLSAAKTKSPWIGNLISMRSPIVNIDFWDAFAYAKWKDHRLPTKEEWMAVAGKLKLNGVGDPPCPVDSYKQDVDATGLCGFASGVREWTSSIARDISRPTEPPKRISCGGSSSRPGLNQVHYEASSEERSPDLGFRTIRN